MVQEEWLSKREECTPDKTKLTLTFVVCASLVRGLCAQVATVIPVAPEPVGSGARALGQSAFIAVADDATAASWNPAGLINLEEPEASFVGAWRSNTNDILLRDPFPGESYNGDSWSDWEVNFMSYAQPIAVGNRDVVLSINYHQVYDLGLEYTYTSLEEGSRVVSEGAISAYSVAGGFSIPPCPQITIGGSFNWYAQSLHNSNVRRVTSANWVIHDLPDSGPTRVPDKDIETLDDLHGYNFTFGLLWDAWERGENLLTLGLVCDTPFTAELIQEIVRIDADGDRHWEKPERLEIEFPLSLGAGANYRFSDRFSTAFDVQWAEWSQYTYTDALSTPSGDTVAYRLGAEYLTFFQGARESVLACRGGVFYEPRPAWGDTLPVYGFSLGLGWTVKERFSLDFAYQFRWGEEDNLRVNPTTSIDYAIEEDWLIASVIVYVP